MIDREKVINGLQEAVDWLSTETSLTVVDQWVVRDALALLKTQEPRVLAWDEVKKKINSGEYVFTECEKEGQYIRYGYAKLAIDNGDSCKIAFLLSGDREDNPYAVWWWVSYRNYNKTWRCWTTPRPTAKQMEEVKWG